MILQVDEPDGDVSSSVVAEPVPPDLPMILQLCIICHYKLIMALLANVLSTFLGRLQAPPCAFFSMVAVLTT